MKYTRPQVSMNLIIANQNKQLDVSAPKVTWLDNALIKSEDYLKIIKKLDFQKGKLTR